MPTRLFHTAQHAVRTLHATVTTDRPPAAVAGHTLEAGVSLRHRRVPPAPAQRAARMELQDVSIDAPAGAGAGSSGSAVISASQAPYTRSTGDADGSMALAGGNNGRYGADSSTTRVKVLLAVLACGALVCWVAALAMLAGKPLATYSVIAPPSADSADSRDYRVVFLENGLEVLLVSDPETKVSAAAVDVKVRAPMACVRWPPQSPTHLHVRPGCVPRCVNARWAAGPTRRSTRAWRTS